MILFPFYKTFCIVKNLNFRYCINILQKPINREKHTPHGSYEYSMVGESSFLAINQLATSMPTPRQALKICIHNTNYLRCQLDIHSTKQERNGR